MKKISTGLLLILLFITKTWAISGATGSPSTISHSAKINPPVTIRWNLKVGDPTLNSSGSMIAETLTGTILPASPATSGFGPNITINCPTATTCTPTSDTFTIPSSIITSAVNNGISSFYVTRTISNTATKTSSKARVRVDLVNPISHLNISRESLRFSDYKTSKTVKTNTKLFAQAELKYTGSGLLDAFWEYSSSISSNSSGEAIYTRLGSVRRYLGSGGRIVLQSPMLPSHARGNYQVRLQILKTPTNPAGVIFTSDLPDGLPILRYNVIQGGKKTYKEPRIKTLAPVKNALIMSDTLFSWKAVKGANAYQLELYLLDTPQQPKNIINSENKRNEIDESQLQNTKPAAGLLLPAKTTSLSLSAVARENLHRSKTYYWRIIAIGKKGEVLTVSNIQTVRTP